MRETEEALGKIYYGYDAFSAGSNLGRGQRTSMSYYVGKQYEVAGSTVKKYYDAGGTRVAMHNGGTLHWLLGDHLGSTAYTVSGTTGPSGRPGTVRYKAFGGGRASCHLARCSRIPGKGRNQLLPPDAPRPRVPAGRGMLVASNSCPFF